MSIYGPLLTEIIDTSTKAEIQVMSVLRLRFGVSKVWSKVIWSSKISTKEI